MTFVISIGISLQRKSLGIPVDLHGSAHSVAALLLLAALQLHLQQLAQVLPHGHLTHPLFLAAPHLVQCLLRPQQLGLLVANLLAQRVLQRDLELTRVRALQLCLRVFDQQLGALLFDLQFPVLILQPVDVVLGVLDVSTDRGGLGGEG